MDHYYIYKFINCYKYTTILYWLLSLVKLSKQYTSICFQSIASLFLALQLYFKFFQSLPVALCLFLSPERKLKVLHPVTEWVTCHCWHFRSGKFTISKNIGFLENFILYILLKKYKKFIKFLN